MVGFRAKLHDAADMSYLKGATNLRTSPRPPFFKATRKKFCKHPV